MFFFQRILINSIFPLEIKFVRIDTKYAMSWNEIEMEKEIFFFR